MLSSEQHRSLKMRTSALWQEEMPDEPEPKGDIFTIIMAIFQAIMAACPAPQTPKSIKAICNRPGQWEKWVVNHYTRSELGIREYRRSGVATAKIAFALGKETDEETIAAACEV